MVEPAHAGGLPGRTAPADHLAALPISPAPTHSFRSDFVGRINNISLAPSPNNALAPLFETITNAMQAIEDQFGIDHIAKGRIEVEVLRPTADHAKPSGFTIRDNGIGFNHANLDLFLHRIPGTSLLRGGKGVGRFLWLKVFQKAHVSSHYEDQGYKEVAFDFVLSDDAQIRNLRRHANPRGRPVHW